MNKIISLAMFSGVLVVLTGCPTAPGPDPLPPSPKVVRFGATPTLVRPGAKVTLTWEVTDAATVTITDVKRGDVSGVENKLSGTVQVTPDANALYVITAVNARGAKATAVASVRVEGADTAKVIFAAYPAVVAAGETATLVWNAPRAGAVAIAPMGGTAIDLKGQLAAGTVQVNPNATETTYELSVDGTTAQSVKVTRAPVISALALSKKLLLPAAMVDVTWKAAHSTKVTLSSPTRGTIFETTDLAKIADGSFADTVPALANGSSLGWTLTATGPGGIETRTLGAVIGPDPVVRTLVTPEYAKVGGTFVATWTTVNAEQVQVRLGSTVVYETPTAALATSGSLTLPTPTAEQTWTVAARAVNGVEATKTFTVKPIGPAGVTTFTVSPANVTDGGSAVAIVWNTPNARNLRVLQDGELTVAASTGPSSETGTATAYVNRRASNFLLSADNTLDPAVTADAGVTVGNVAELFLNDGGLIFESAGPIDLATPLGTEVYGLPHTDVVTIVAATTFDDISTSGKRLTTPTEDSVATLPVPNWETFLFSTRLSSALSVSTNGWLTFTSTTTPSPAAPTTFPSTSALGNLYAPFWTDLEFTPATMDSGVFWQLKGSAPDQTLIVQWNKLRVKGAATSSLTFQVRITQVGTVTYEYKTLTNLPTTPTFVTGLQGTPGVGLVATPVAGASVQFFGPKTTPIAWLSTKLPVSGWAKLANGYARISLTKFVRTADLNISEVMYAPVASATAGEWFEVRNATNTSFDLGGYVIDFGAGSTHTIAGPLVVPANGLVVLGQSTDTAANDGVTVNYAYGTGFSMPDTGGSVSLRGVATLTATWTATGPGAVGVAGVYDTTPALTATGLVNGRTCAATATYGTATPTLQRGTPGAAGSCFVTQTNIPVSYFDISATGTVVNFPVENDDDVTTISLASAPITLRGVQVTSLSVCTNGWLVAGASTSTSFSNKSVPSTSSPVGTIAPFWDDLVVIGSVQYQRMAAGADVNNPAAHWIVQWTNTEHFLGGDNLNFQVKFFDSGIVEYHYAMMMSGSTANYANGNSATVWFENTGGTVAMPVSVNQPNITSNMAVRFAP